ncbi:protein kinase domain-containing protein [Streptomyces collinus]
MNDADPRVIDFGIARALDHVSLTPDSVVIGTPGFMSPEQINGAEQGPAGDVFILGAVLVFAATGQGPFGEGPSLALLQRDRRPAATANPEATVPPRPPPGPGSAPVRTRSPATAGRPRARHPPAAR